MTFYDIAIKNNIDFLLTKTIFKYLLNVDIWLKILVLLSADQ
jgi:hypothetical protein